MPAGDEERYDVLVVGGGNAALCAAIAARHDGARVVVLERAPEAERGGNSTFTDGVVSARLTAEGSEVIGGSPEEFSTYMKAELERWAKVIKVANVRID